MCKIVYGYVKGIEKQIERTQREKQKLLSFSHTLTQI
jgi:hypothetical protein